MIMEMCEGQTVQQNRPQAVQETVRIFVEVAGALAHMNGNGVVHADMKPNNIIVSAEGVVKVINLGQSCPVGTVKARIQGTPDFIAPEQVHRRPVERADRRVQLRGVPVLDAHRAAHSHRPAQGGVADANDGQRIAPSEQLNPQIPKPLGKLVTDCIEIVPAQGRVHRRGPFPLEPDSRAIVPRPTLRAGQRRLRVLCPVRWRTSSVTWPG